MIEPILFNPNSNHKEQIRTALANLDFVSFFKLINGIDVYERYSFVLLALDVAKLQNNIEAIEHLVEVEVTSIWRKDVFEHVLGALVELKRMELAFSLIIYNENKTFKAGEGWYLLAKILASQGRLAETRQIMGYIKEPAQQEEVFQVGFKKLNLPHQFLSWLDWFEWCIEQNENALNESVKPVIQTIANVENFEGMCERLKKIKDSKPKEKLLHELYLHLLIARQEERLAKLNLILPGELNGLIKIAGLFSGSGEWFALDHVGLNNAQLIIPIAVRELIEREQFNGDSALVLIITKAANQVEKYQEYIIEAAFNNCMQVSRLNVAIGLLDFLSNFKRSAIQALRKVDLSEAQYQALLQHIKNLDELNGRYYHSDEEEVKKIPQHLISAEYARRSAELCMSSKQQFRNVNSINSKHEKWNEINSVIEKLLKYKQFTAAFELCKKLVPSNHRDQHLLACFCHALKERNFNRAKAIAKLCVKKMDVDLLNQLIGVYETSHYRAAFKILTQCNNKIELSPLLQDCVNQVLNEPDNIAVTEFLMGNELFSLDESEFAEDVIKTVREQVAKVVLQSAEKRGGITQVVNHFKTMKIHGFEMYFVEEVLKKDNLELLVDLLNACFEEVKSYEECNWSRELEDKITDYIRTLVVNSFHLANLARLQRKFLRDNWVDIFLRNINENLSIDKLQLIATLQVPELKNKYLIKAIIVCLEENKLALAKRALLFLSGSYQPVWKQIIEFAEQGRMSAIINLMLAGEFFELRLLLIALEKWAKNNSPSYLHEHLLKFSQLLKALNQEKPTALTLDYLNRQVEKRQVYESLISYAFSYWQQHLVQAKDYDNYQKGMSALLPLVEDQHSFLTGFVATAKSMIEDQDYRNALLTIELLIKSRENFVYYYFGDLFNLALKKEAFALADKLLALVLNDRSFQVDQCLIKLSVIYFERKDYARVGELLRQRKSSFTIDEQVKKWAVDLIKKDKTKEALDLVQALLMTAQNEAYFVEIVEQLLLAKKELPTILNLIETKITHPGSLLRLKGQLKEVYYANLEDWIGKETVASLKWAQKKISKFFQLKDEDQGVSANLFKNEVITELRSLLDKAFLEFYRKNFGEPPKIKGNILNVFFPVVPELKGEPIRKRLHDDYFSKKLKINNFQTRFPELYQYIESIQPLINQSYLWLDQLYKLANKQKHDKDLPLSPEIEGVKIDMATYLPKLIDGVTEILLKLTFPKLDLKIISRFQFSRFVTLNVNLMQPEYNKTSLFGNKKSETDMSVNNMESNSNKEEIKYDLA